MFAEIGRKFLGIFGSDDQNDHISFDELLAILAQLRQVRAAERSLKAAVQDQQDVLLTFELGQPDLFPLVVPEAEIWRGYLERNLRHGFQPYHFLAIRSSRPSRQAQQKSLGRLRLYGSNDDYTQNKSFE